MRETNNRFDKYINCDELYFDVIHEVWGSVSLKKIGVYVNYFLEEITTKTIGKSFPYMN